MQMAASGAEAVIRTDLTEGWFPQAIPVATIPGTQEPDRFVLVHGHYDSWTWAWATTQPATQRCWSWARVLWQGRAGLRRSVRLAWWPGHSTGRYAGSTWFADRFARDLDRNCLAQINCDSPGCRWATSYHDTRAFTESAGIAAAAIRDVVPDADIRTMRPPQAGDYSFNNIGLPSLFMLSSTMPEALRHEKGYYDVSGCGANIAWHTENDTLEIADPAILLTDMRIYLLAVLRIANAAVLPFDWTATCDEFLATIARYQTAAGDLADLSACTAAVTALRASLVALEGADPARRNAVLLGLSRILVPINTTREPRFRHDPAYTVPPLPTIAVAAELPGYADDHMRRVAGAELMRGANRLLAALDDARRLIEAALPA